MGSSESDNRLLNSTHPQSTNGTTLLTTLSSTPTLGHLNSQNVCINSTTEELHLPDHSSEPRLLPSNVLLVSTDSNKKQKKVEDFQSSDRGNAHASSRNSIEQGDVEISSGCSSSTDDTGSNNPSIGATPYTGPHPHNIKHQLKRRISSAPGSRSKVGPEVTVDSSGSGTHSSQSATDPNMGLFKDSKKAVNNEDFKEKTPFFVYYLACFATIGGLLFGYDTGIVSGAMLLITDVFHLSTIWQELIVSATVGSAAIFSLLAGFMCDFLGRKTTIMIASVVFVAGAIVMGASENKEMLMAGRIIVGVGIGFASMTVPVYIAEAAPPEIRGRLVTLNQLFITIGILISSIIAGAFSKMKQDGWRYMLALAGVPGIIQFIGFIYLPESPRWLVMKGKDERAMKVLQRIRGKENVQDEINEIKQAVEEDKKNEGLVIGRVFATPHVRKALFVGCGLQIFQQLCGINTVIYYSATILKMAGFPPEDAIWLVLVPNAINFCSTIAGVALVERLGRKKLMIGSFIGVLIALIVLAVGFQLSANFSPELYNMTSGFEPGSQLLNDTCFMRQFSNCEKCIDDTDCGFCYRGDGINGTCLSVADEDKDLYSKYGSCNKTLKSSLDMKFSHQYCPTDYTWMAVLGLALFVMAFAPGLGPMPWTINSEIYPMWARSTGNSLATGCNWVCNLIVSLVFLTMTENITKYGTFWLFAGISCLGMLFTIIFVPETKNKTLEEVEELFGGKKKGGSENLGYERDIPSPNAKHITRL
uniref:Major facilitator superfamily (MFS) profile domain-containing protein n=1 Tax=Arion vulgaris TaxID=1028688 RepID=A0A0B7A4X1_9EUPU